MRVLRGKLARVNGTATEWQVLTTVEDPAAVEGTVNAYVNQDWNHITVISPFGSMSFHRQDADVVTANLHNLADFIERSIVP